ncbi:hypothetical protein C9374_003455 [Naegleria lovaniensis]|uniref:Fucosyltransferase n=1 Tax=Naegleria lovaniensis TaxID=51637 RepID=A0AA88GMY0_NAELO|nr:uncharacterized protein C9374_003455 [Naegleria lovaniensis]KAG2385640.1 hypothetical protein C9374_003455 [Naegleria lovaniensis]
MAPVSGLNSVHSSASSSSFGFSSSSTIVHIQEEPEILPTTNTCSPNSNQFRLGHGTTSPAGKHKGSTVSVVRWCVLSCFVCFAILFFLLNVYLIYHSLSSRRSNDGGSSLPMHEHQLESTTNALQHAIQECKALLDSQLPSDTGTNAVKNNVVNKGVPQSNNMNANGKPINNNNNNIRNYLSKAMGGSSLTVAELRQKTYIKSQFKDITKLDESFIDPFLTVPKRPTLEDPYMIKEVTSYLNELHINDKGCGHTLNRNYSQNPVHVYGKFRGEFEGCAVRCVGDGTFNSSIETDVFVNNIPSMMKRCPHTKQYTFSMENVAMQMGVAEKLVGSTKLGTDVPVPYYSWAEYDFMKPPVPKTASAMMAVFISNCGPEKRLKILEELMNYGVTVHSFGRCLNNAKVPAQFVGGYLDQKTALTAMYKFTFAAENSESDDYVTEKLFGTLSSGSVPVYLGAPNARKFSPSKKSVIYVSDFESTEQLANYLIELDRDDAKYNEYLKWKQEGPSPDFMALVDLALVHSSCRLCIRVADHHRAMYGNRVGHEVKKISMQQGTLALQVRPRGEFFMKYLYLEQHEQNMTALQEKILELYKDHSPFPGKVYSIYRLWDRLQRPIDDNDFTNGVLAQDIELEVIFTYPNHPGRGQYTLWQQRQ